MFFDLIIFFGNIYSLSYNILRSHSGLAENEKTKRFVKPDNADLNEKKEDIDTFLLNYFN